MRPFALTREMLNYGGQFYPTGHIVAMFPTEAAARDAARRLVLAGTPEDDVLWITPEAFTEQVAHGVDLEDPPLPSAGTETSTVRHFAELAAQGHYGLVIHAPDAKHQDAVLQALQESHPSYAQRYRRLVIEDIAE